MCTSTSEQYLMCKFAGKQKKLISIVIELPFRRGYVNQEAMGQRSISYSKTLGWGMQLVALALKVLCYLKRSEKNTKHRTLKRYIRIIKSFLSNLTLKNWKFYRNNYSHILCQHQKKP